MKMNMITMACLMVAAILFVSCDKQPTASFAMDKWEYYAGETVNLMNTSTDGDHYQWNLPDGAVTSTTNTSFTIDPYTDGGFYTFTLTAFSRNEKKSDVASQTVAVYPGKGEVTFWTTLAGAGDITVLFGGNVAHISYFYGSDPGCDSYGCANFYEVPYGRDYHLYAYNGTYYWDTYMDIDAPCHTMELSYKKARKIGDHTPLPEELQTAVDAGRTIE